MKINLRAPGYNPPTSFAMFLSQWAHQMFLWNWMTYEQYDAIQDWVYKVFG